MAGKNIYGSWTDADEKAVEDLRDLAEGTSARAELTDAERAYSIEKGYIEVYDDAILREAKKEAAREEEEDGKTTYPKKPLTFGDLSGQMPRAEYENSTSINFSAKQNYTSHYLDIAGTVGGIDVAQYTTGISAKYPLNQVIETVSGHVIEYNDTPESSRILIKHNTGSGIDMRPDGTIVVSSHGEGKVEVNHGGHKLVVTGDGQLHFSGDLTLNVGGDFNVNVGGSFNVQAKEETKTINGPSRDLYFGNKYTSIVGSRQDFMTENYSSAALGFRDVYTKGDHKTIAEGGGTMAMKGGIAMSSEVQITQSAPDINIAAEDISVFGASGNIGGDGVIMHNYNMFTGHSIWAEETVNTKTVTATKTMNAISFHGDLFGTATSALAANVAAAPGGGGASQTSSTDATFDTKGQTNRATTDVMAEYLYKGGYGIQKIFVDKGDHLKGAYDKTRDTGGVTKRILNTNEVRARMRDAGHRENGKFPQYQSSAGTINPKYNNPVPASVKMVVDPKKVTVTGRNVAVGAKDSKARVKPEPNLKAPISVDPRFNPASADQILTTTKLTRSITLSQFVYGKGDPGKLDPNMRLEEKKQLVRNLIPHANMVQRIRDNQDMFKGYNIEIIEGVYVKEPEETITQDGILDLRTQGRAVVYEVIGPNGLIDKDKTFDLAVWLSANIRYDEILLDYDELDPRGQGEDHNVQIIVIMPVVKEDFTADFQMKTGTLFNNINQGKEFIKFGDKKSPVKLDGVDPTDLETTDAEDELRTIPVPPEPATGGEPTEEVQPEPEAPPAEEAPVAKYTGNPEILDGKFKTEAEVENFLRTNKLNAASNGYSFVFNGKQFWVTVNPVELKTLANKEEAMYLTQSYETFREDQLLFGPVGGRSETGKQAYADGLW